MKFETDAVLKVGNGRGFIVERNTQLRFVITAAHCLPNLPPAHAGSYPEERTYQNLLGPPGETTVWAECLFVDPVADIAVLMSADVEQFESEEDAFAFDVLTGPRPALRIGDVNTSLSSAWLLSLSIEWNPCKVKTGGGPYSVLHPLWLKDATAGIFGGMSASPILNDAGEAIGIISVSVGVIGDGEERGIHTEGGPNPRLSQNLPGWLLKD
jgi:hypothetical protein